MSTSYRMQDPRRFELHHGTDPRNGRELVILSVEDDLYRDAFAAARGRAPLLLEQLGPTEGRVRGAVDWATGCLGADGPEDWSRAGDEHLAGAPDFIPAVLALAGRSASPLLVGEAPSLERRADRLSQDVYLTWLVKQSGAIRSEIFRLVGLAFRADRTPLIEAIADALTPASTDLLRDGAGDHRLAAFKDRQDELCLAVYDAAEDDD